MEETAFRILAVHGQVGEIQRMAICKADMIELQALDAVHCCQSQRSRIVDIHRFSGDFEHRTAALDQCIGVSLAFDVGVDRDAGNMTTIGFTNIAMPDADAPHLVFERLKGLKSRIRPRHTGMVAFIAVVATIEIVDVLVLQDRDCPAAGFLRSAVVELEPSSSAPDVNAKLAEDDVVAIDVLVAVANEKQIVSWIALRWDHRPDQSEGLRVEVLNFIDNDMLETGIEALCDEDRTGGAEHVGGLPELILIEQGPVLLEDRPDSLALEAVEPALASPAGQRGIAREIRNIVILNHLVPFLAKKTCGKIAGIDFFQRLLPELLAAYIVLVIDDLVVVIPAPEEVGTP